MGKVRVHDITREYGLTAREVVDRLHGMGEFVKNSSSTLEPPVEARLRTTLGDPLPPDQRRKTRGEVEREAWQAEAGPIRSWEGIRQEWRANIIAKMPKPPTALELEVRRRQREQKRGKRFRGQIDVATQEFLRGIGAHNPPFLDQYEQAKGRTDEWLSVGWIAPEEIVRWRHTCPGVWPETAIALAKAGVSPRLAANGLSYGKIDADAPTLWSRVQSREMSAEDAKWLLQKARLLAA